MSYSLSLLCTKRYWNLEDTQEGEYGAEHAVAEAGREQGKCHGHHLHTKNEKSLGRVGSKSKRSDKKSEKF